MGNKAIGVASLGVGAAFIAVAVGQLMDGNIGSAISLGLLGLVGVVAGARVGSSRDDD